MELLERIDTPNSGVDSLWLGWLGWLGFGILVTERSGVLQASGLFSLMLRYARGIGG